MKTNQYTIRGIEERLDGVVREKAAAYGTSLNALLLDALKKGLGFADEPASFSDMDELAGTWVEDDGFDEALAAFEAVDEDLWK